MEVVKTSIEGCLKIKFDQYVDHRGMFQECWRDEDGKTWMQDNASISFNNVLRGLHVQRKNPQGKLMRCFGGEVFDVCVDLRLGSPTYGKWEYCVLTWDNPLGFVIPPGCAHGFYVTGDAAMVYYKCSTLWDKETDTGIIWNDPTLAINWPIKPGSSPMVSPKDQRLPLLLDFEPIEL